MIIQISSGQGPAECELAVSKLFHSLKKEYPDITILSEHKSKHSGCAASIQFRTESDLLFLEGTVQWICKSPFRPKHKRKNWFVDVSILKNEDNSEETFSSPLSLEISDKELEWTYFHCGGKGGQNVNKVQTGVRLTHIKSGITVTSTAERNQLQNRKNALDKLCKKLDLLKEKKLEEDISHAHSKHSEIVRGNPSRVYVGEKFVLLEES